MDGGFALPVLVAPAGNSLTGADTSCILLDTGPRFAVRQHRIEPGASLPPCYHLHRAEHWTVVQGTTRLTREGSAQLFSEGQSFLVPLGQSHALENPGRIPLILIEVWTGAYLADDDLIACSNA